MKFTRQQRINNVASEMVQGLNQIANQYDEWLKNGLNFPASNDGYPALKTTGEEIKEALHENVKTVQTVIEFIKGGKSNRITKGEKKK